MARLNKKVGNALRRNRKVKIYIFFLFLSTLIWLLIELSKTYTNTTNLKVSFYNLPIDKSLLATPITEIKAVVKASGFQLIKYHLNPPKIDFDLNRSSYHHSVNYLLPNNQLSELKTTLSKDASVVRFLSDTIFIEFGRNIFKKVPVIANLKVHFKLGYNFIEDLKISPDSVTISGPKKNIDSINEVSTVKIELEDIYENIELEALIKLPSKAKNVHVSNNKVVIQGNIDKFTEGTFLIPVSIVHKPKNITIVPFPKEIEVIYQSGLSNFSKIKKNDIAIEFDYLQYSNDTLVKYLTPIIKSKSEFISSLKINPAQIEFLIQN